ncbi:MAG: hypothetical protein ABIE84_06600 [bacterium]
MNKNLIIGLIVGVLVILAVIIIGCQSTSLTSVSASNVVLKGVAQNAASVTATNIKSYTWPEGESPCNSNFPIVITTPESYAVGLYQVQFYKTLDDTTPYLLASWEAAGETPQHFDLTGSPTQMAANEDYPAAGEYTHMKPTIAYLEQTLPAGMLDYQGMTKFRTIMGEYGEFQIGDVLVSSGEGWYWIDTDSGVFASVDGTRPTELVQVDWGSEATVEVNGHIVFEPTDVSMESFTMTADPSGTYTFTLVFDLAATFAFNDLNNNGVFEPGIEYPLGDAPTNAIQLVSGEAEWNVGPPGLSVTLDTE